MHNPLLLIAVISSAVLLWLSRWLFSHLRLKWAQSRPFPENWLEIMQRRLPVYKDMPEDLQEQLQTHVRTFLWHKRFIGCAGQEVTEEMRVTIAACACLLLLNRPTHKFKDVRWIYLYPAEFIARHTVADAAGVMSHVSSLLSGEAWSNGRVILAWDDVAKGVRDFNDGRNVVLHEFAHQLDSESGDANGAPLLYSQGAYGTWAAIMSREFQALRDHSYFGEQTVLDTYGATNPAEFFAVATESFFEEPDALADEYADLYEELRKYFQVDPRTWKPKPVVKNESEPPSKNKKDKTKAGQSSSGQKSGKSATSSTVRPDKASTSPASSEPARGASEKRSGGASQADTATTSADREPKAGAGRNKTSKPSDTPDKAERKPETAPTTRAINTQPSKK